MRKYFYLLIFAIGTTFSLNAQSCSEIMSYVKSESYGTSYSSYSSDAISSVSFHSVLGDSYNTLYFAIVQFKSSYTEYIYQVGSNTERNYLMNYQASAGQAFFNYIEPYSDALGCAPSF